MSEAPKEIWVDDEMIAWAQYSEDDTRYIRADIVDDLLEALELLASYGNVFAHRHGQPNPYEKAISAIRKARNDE